MPRPPSVNAAYINNKGGKEGATGRFKSKAYKEWQKVAAQALLAQRRPAQPLNVPMEMVVNLPLTKAVADAGNYEKCTADFLKHMHIIADDSLIRRNTQQWVAGLKYAVVELFAYDGPRVTPAVIGHIEKPWDALAGYVR